MIVLVDLVLLEKPAYRHLLYNSGFQSYWKLMVVLLLSESFKAWSSFERHEINDDKQTTNHKNDSFDGERSFYILLAHTGLSLGAFVLAVIIGTELRWLVTGKRPHKYTTADLVCALIVGGCAKLLGLLGLVWEHVAEDPHYALIYGYTMLCLLTAYSGNLNSIGMSINKLILIYSPVIFRLNLYLPFFIMSLFSAKMFYSHWKYNDIPCDLLFIK